MRLILETWRYLCASEAAMGDIGKYMTITVKPLILITT